MGSLAGNSSKIYQHLKEFQIVTGKLGPTEISAWYDTFDKATLTFLKWFEDYITQENFLTYTESIVYNELLEKNLIQEPSKYERFLQEYETEYPKLFEQEFNEIECEFLKFEDKNLDEELEDLETLLLSYKEQIKYAKEHQSEMTDKCVKMNFKRDEQAAVSLELAGILDEINTNLRDQVLKCATIIQSSDNFIAMRDAYFEEHSDYVNMCNLEVIRICNYCLENLPLQEDSCNSLDITSNSSLSTCYIEDSFYNNSEYDERNSVVMERLVQATSQRIFNTGRVKVAHAQIKYLQELISSGVFRHVQRQNNYVILSYQEAVLRRVQNLINLPKVLLTRIRIATVNSRIEYCTSFQEKLDEMMQYQVLLMQLLSTEKKTMEGIKSIIEYVEEYMSCEIRQCQERIEIMNAINNDYNTYVSQPFEDKWHLLRKILMIIDAKYDNVTLTEAQQAIKDFHEKCDKLEEKLYLNDIDLFIKDVRLIETTNKTLKTFLCSETTSQLTVVPYKTYSAMKSTDDLVESQNKLIKYYTSMPKQIKTQLDSNKWQKIKRQLWMYFLTKPEKLEKIIIELECEIRKKRAAFLTN